MAEFWNLQEQLHGFADVLQGLLQRWATERRERTRSKETLDTFLEEEGRRYHIPGWIRQWLRRKILHAEELSIGFTVTGDQPTEY